MTKEQTILSAYGSHNASVALYHQSKYWVVEVERWIAQKNSGLSFYNPVRNPQFVLDEICRYLFARAGIKKADLYLYNYMKKQPQVEIAQTKNYRHHEAHAACTFYQSPFDKALVISFDGGGDDGFFNIYKFDSRQSQIDRLAVIPVDLGMAYMIMGHFLADIKREDIMLGNLVYPGKMMGLCAYGKVQKKWLPHFEKFFEKYHADTPQQCMDQKQQKIIDAPKALFEDLEFKDFDFRVDRIEGQKAYDLAATHQHAFEQHFFKLAQPYLDEYKDWPLCLVGGSALNVTLNTKLLEQRKGNMFVPPNPNDCGISLGGIFLYQKPEKPVDVTYSGLPVLDERDLSYYLEKGQYILIPMGAELLANMLAQGLIIGVIQGHSEHGPRALGNRSILCTPTGDMKKILNERVKHREWYRPFAPVVRLEDLDEYFDFAGKECRHMTYVATVKTKWRKKLPAITHEDNTARLQTVTEAQNPFLYRVLTEFNKKAGFGVLLNTSFNVDGQPILTRLSDALAVLNNTQLDGVFYKNKLIARRADKEKYEQVLKHIS